MTLNRSSCTGRVLSVFVIIFGGNLCVFLDFNAIQYIKLPFKNQWLIGSNFRNSHKYMVLYNSETFLHNRLLRSQRHRMSFLTALDEKKSRLYANLDPVRMFACASDESAMDEDEKAGGYYTTFLIESAEAWGRQTHGVYSTKKAHDDACVRMAKKNPQQHPQYVPLWQAYPFAVSV